MVTSPLMRTLETTAAAFGRAPRAACVQRAPDGASGGEAHRPAARLGSLASPPLLTPRESACADQQLEGTNSDARKAHWCPQGHCMLMRAAIKVPGRSKAHPPICCGEMPIVAHELCRECHGVRSRLLHALLFDSGATRMWPRTSVRTLNHTALPVSPSLPCWLNWNYGILAASVELASQPACVAT